MPLLWLPDEELEALQSIFRIDERVDWVAYERAKARVVSPPPLPLDALVEALNGQARAVLTALAEKAR